MSRVDKSTIPKFIHALKAATHARLTYHLDGEVFSVGAVDLSTLDISKFDAFHRLYMLFAVVNHYKIDPVICLNAATDWEDVEILYNLIQGVTHSKRVDRGLSFKASVKADGLAGFLKPFSQGSNEIMIESDFRFDIHGTQVARPNTRCRIDKMEVVRQDQPLSMGWCLQCHRDPKPNLRPKDQVTNMEWTPEMAVNWTAPDVNPPQHCSGCHR